ncbi:TetR/AcrR family transcriptional regulator [Mycolicibacterium sp. P1-5]|uniref:TetR/AcrR family transcriptional regulator n=1 Tax=Mycolicibacterium sp. P1-5 TaxID=2024617 RepID=UPI0011EF439F|nr:TetR/AcrR family transcriptional regulator [Mycolicibacterium sp. P1-5]KAA0106094.1 TetR/AcrR family transcriptional regulator [Mycolicibacterium sp. P1-5]
MTEPTVGRSAQKRRAILSTAQSLFLTNGYRGTSVDQIAAGAGVSKQTVYKHFGDKHELLVAIVNETLGDTMTPILDRIAALADTADIDTDLANLARDYISAVLQDPVVQLRRLVIGEANRVPELAQVYYEQAQGRSLNAFTEAFARLNDRRLLAIDDPALAAEHFAFLVIGRCVDQALFLGAENVRADVDVVALAEQGLGVFLSAYRARS